MEIIEILDSDEEGDERVRIVQQRHEPSLRPIQEEGNGDGDVIITGTRGGLICWWRGGQRERSARVSPVFFSTRLVLFFSRFQTRERFFGCLNFGNWFAQPRKEISIPLSLSSSFIDARKVSSALARADRERFIFSLPLRFARSFSSSHVDVAKNENRRRRSRNTTRYRAPAPRVRDAQVR